MNETPENDDENNENELDGNLHLPSLGTIDWQVDGTRAASPRSEGSHEGKCLFCR